MSAKLDMPGVDKLSAKLSKLSQTGRDTARQLIAKGAAKVADAIRSRTPVQRATRKTRTRIHLKSAVTIEERQYRKGSITVQMVGAPARQQPHQWIVEDGTRKRVTNQKRVKLGRKITGFTERTYFRKMKDGTRKKSVYIRNTYQTEYKTAVKRKNRPQLNRGKMPASHMFRDGAKSVNTRVHSDIVDGLRQAIEAAAGGAS